MSPETQEREQSPSADEAKDPRARAARDLADGDRGLEMVAHAAQGAELDEEEEGAALDYLLGAKKPVQHEIEVKYDTEAGLVPMWFVVRSTDTRKIDTIEEKNIDQNTGRIDRLTADCEIVAQACVGIRDRTGRVVKLTSPEFLTVRAPSKETGEMESVSLASPALALDARFRDQLGLISGVAMEIKRAAGFSPERVSRAKRLLVTASLG